MVILRWFLFWLFKIPTSPGRIPILTGHKQKKNHQLQWCAARFNNFVRHCYKGLQLAVGPRCVLVGTIGILGHTTSLFLLLICNRHHIIVICCRLFNDSFFFFTHQSIYPGMFSTADQTKFILSPPITWSGLSYDNDNLYKINLQVNISFWPWYHSTSRGLTMDWLEGAFHEHNWTPQLSKCLLYG